MLALPLYLQDLQESQVPEAMGKAYLEDIPLVEGDQVRGYLGELDKSKSMGPAGMHARVPREVPDAIARPLSTTFD